MAKGLTPVSYPLLCLKWFGIFKVRPDIPAFNNVLFSPLCVMTLREIRQQDLISFPYITFGLPWKLNSERIHLQCRRPGSNPWVGKIPWRRKWQPTPVFLPGKSHGWRSLVGYCLWGRTESDTTEANQQQQQQVRESKSGFVQYLPSLAYLM